MSGAASTFRLDGELTIYRAAELKPLLLRALDAAPAALEIDLSEVTEIDTAGVQLLLMAQRHAGARGLDLRLGARSAPVADAFELLDLGGHFGAATAGTA